uniref:Uncharacterized protein n=1 Tax=Cacopsylla melanoneura TaxID=428564 RepID=A0A8D9A8J5_9HEMI
MFLTPFSHVFLGLPTGLGLSYWRLRTRLMLEVGSARATCPAHCIILDLMILVMGGLLYRVLSSAFFLLLHSFISVSNIGPNIFLNTLFSNACILDMMLVFRGQVSLPYSITGCMIEVYIFILAFLDIFLDVIILFIEYRLLLALFILLLISESILLFSFISTPRYLKSVTFSNVWLFILTFLF